MAPSDLDQATSQVLPQPPPDFEIASPFHLCAGENRRSFLLFDPLLKTGRPVPEIRI